MSRDKKALWQSLDVLHSALALAIANVVSVRFGSHSTEKMLELDTSLTFHGMKRETGTGPCDAELLEYWQ